MQEVHNKKGHSLITETVAASRHFYMTQLRLVISFLLLFLFGGSQVKEKTLHKHLIVQVAQHKDTNQTTLEKLPEKKD